MAFKGAGDKEPERRHPGALQDGEGSLQDGRPRRQPQGVDLPLSAMSVGRTAARRCVGNSQDGRKLHFHAPIGSTFYIDIRHLTLIYGKYIYIMRAHMHIDIRKKNEYY